MLESVKVNSKKLNVTAAELQKALHNKELKRVYREGKELYFNFGEHTLALHLMLHGKLYLSDEKNEQKYTIIELCFKGGTSLALTDWQGAATPTLNPKAKEAPDALADTVTTEWWAGKLTKKKSTVKNLLLDQKFIRGIGNAYADEILYDSMISPFSISNKIPEQSVLKLAKSVKKVLENAQKQIQKFRPNIISGEFRDFLNVHQPGKKETPNGEKILVENGTRKTYYVAEQEVFK